MKKLKFPLFSGFAGCEAIHNRKENVLYRIFRCVMKEIEFHRLLIYDF